jgi:acyl carrier protein
LDIEAAVFSHLREILDNPERDLQLSNRLIKDLKIDSDALSFEFAIPLMWQLGINVPDMAWINVYTIEDTINILRKYRQ